MTRSTTGPIAVALLLLACGCSGGQPKSSSSKQSKAKVPADTPEKRTADEIAWNNRAAKLLPLVVDQAAADAHAVELKKLVVENEQLKVRLRADKTWEWTQEEKDSLEKEYGEKLRQSRKSYIDAARPYDVTGKRKDLVTYLIDRYGIDIRRMKQVTTKD